MHVDKLSLSVGHLNIEECWPMCLVTHLAFGILHEAICPPYSPTSNNNASYPHKKKKKKTHTHTHTNNNAGRSYVCECGEGPAVRPIVMGRSLGVRLDHVCTSAFLCFYLFFFFFFFFYQRLLHC